MGIDITKIVNSFTSLDKTGEDANKIDTSLELCELGEYLNGKTTYTDDNNVTYGFYQLDLSQQNVIEELYKNAKMYIAEKFCKNDDAMKITDNNVNIYLKLLCQFNYKNNITEVELKMIDTLQQKLYKYCQESE